MTGIKLPRLCPTTWTDDLLSDAWCREGERIVILCGMRSLWNSRNDNCHGKQPIGHVQAIDRVLDACYFLMTARSSSSRERAPVLVETWCAPPENVHKVNCDRDFLEDSKSGSTGAVLRRRSDGSFQRASSRWLATVASPLTAEAEACREGLQLAWQRAAAEWS
jgi:hypothetical protein